MQMMPQVKPAPHEARDHNPYREWCRACVGGAGRCDAHRHTHTRQHEEQHAIPVASMDYRFFTDGQEQTSGSDGQITKAATPFLVVKV